jgi:membrane fusion protein, heavy metal efflux system
VRARVLGLTLVIACGPREPLPEPSELRDEVRSLTTAWVVVARPSDAAVLELPGRIVAAAETRAQIETPLRAMIVATSVQVGDRVEAGAAIVELRMPEALEAAAALAGAGKQIDAHEARRERLEQLKSAGLVGAGEVFDVERGLGQLSAQRRLALATLAAVGVDTASKRRDLLARGTVILRAPIPGVVVELDAIPGAVVEPGANLGRLFGLGPARIEVVHTDAMPDDATLEFVGFDGRRVALKPTPVATAIEPGLGRTLAWYEPADDAALAHGVRGRVILAVTDERLLEVPRRSLRLHEGRAWVGVDRGAAEPEMVEVEVLRSVGSSALIRSEGLAVGDRVAADAATVLLLGRDPAELGEHLH